MAAVDHAVGARAKQPVDCVVADAARETGHCGQERGRGREREREGGGGTVAGPSAGKVRCVCECVCDCVLCVLCVCKSHVCVCVCVCVCVFKEVEEGVVCVTDRGGGPLFFSIGRFGRGLLLSSALNPSAGRIGIALA